MMQLFLAWFAIIVMTATPQVVAYRYFRKTAI
jgi:hypothetical protein